MNKKRKVHIDNEFEMLKKPRLANDCDDLLDGIDFDEFENDDFSSTESSSGLTPDADKKSIVLDITTWKRCVINDCQRSSDNTELIISGYEDPIRSGKQPLNNIDKLMVCHLQHSWSQCKIDVGDIVSIIAAWNPKSQCYCITNLNGFIVIRPDLLVSGTTVVSGLFCMRKAILADRFKGIESAIKIVSAFDESKLYLHLYFHFPFFLYR